jgi:alpha-galactosidase
MADIYERFVRTYGVDGLKLDFIDSIGGRPEDETTRQPGHDTASIGQAVCLLLDDVTQRLRAINPDILFEFRQGYVGPAMRKYGNMLRAVDCPNSIVDNRVRTLDVRLLAGNTAVHSDPITWHDDDPNESAAMQLIHALFSVPQLSTKPTELNADHRQMLKNFLAFWRAHRDLLLHGDLEPLYPHLLYLLVVASDSAQRLAAFYGPVPLICQADLPDRLILVNGTYQEHLILDARANLGTYHLSTTDCLGAAADQGPIHLTPGLHQVPVPAAGHAILQKQ